MRPLAVWLPPQYDEGVTRGADGRFPVLYDLVGFTGSGLAHVKWKSFGENVPERAARLDPREEDGAGDRRLPGLLHRARRQPVHQLVGDRRLRRLPHPEIVPFVDREFRTLASRDHRGCFGKSSGGYGAMVHGMRYASTWGAVADHSGDAYFEFVYWHEWPNTLNELAKYRRAGRARGAST